ISIAACTPHETLVGVVYQPITQELFVAEKGKGAFLQGSRLNVSSVDLLSQALLASGFPYDVENNPRGCIDLFSSFLHQGLPIRRLGSAAIDLAYLAAGRWEAYWETGIHPWDIAAGALLVEEAGGKITTWEGMPHPIIKKADILATNGPLHPAMLQALRSPS
ncbi:MAG: inositol monophosphatase, partial [Chlamydiae bacterium]|nr:inositol monophosphatase [Chlamydiota bacterium]